MKALANQWNPETGKDVSNAPFPKNEEDVQKFQTDIARALYSKQQLPHIMKMLESGANSKRLPEMIGHIAATTIVTILKRRNQESGSKVHIKLLIFGLKNAITSLSEIAKKAGLAEMSPEDMQRAIQFASKEADKLIKGGQQGPQQGSPQGQPGQQPQPGQMPQGQPQQPQMPQQGQMDQGPQQPMQQPPM